MSKLTITAGWQLLLCGLLSVVSTFVATATFAAEAERLYESLLQNVPQKSDLQDAESMLLWQARNRELLQQLERPTVPGDADSVSPLGDPLVTLKAESARWVRLFVIIQLYYKYYHYISAQAIQRVSKLNAAKQSPPMTAGELGTLLFTGKHSARQNQPPQISDHHLDIRLDQRSSKRYLSELGGWPLKKAAHPDERVEALYRRLHDSPTSEQLSADVALELKAVPAELLAVAVRQLYELHAEKDLDLYLQGLALIVDWATVVMHAQNFAEFIQIVTALTGEMAQLYDDQDAISSNHEKLAVHTSSVYKRRVRRSRAQPAEFRIRVQSLQKEILQLDLPVLNKPEEPSMNIYHCFVETWLLLYLD
jgi:hypothetical protein